MILSLLSNYIGIPKIKSRSNLAFFQDITSFTSGHTDDLDVLSIDVSWVNEVGTLAGHEKIF